MLPTIAMKLLARSLLVAITFSIETSAKYGSKNINSTYLSRPDIFAPVIKFTTLESALVSPGYILLTPYSPPPGSNLAAGSEPDYSSLTLAELEAILAESKEAILNGPYIYDEDGNLIWSGYGSTGGQYAHDLKISEYDGGYHMTYFTGNDATGGNRGHGVIMDTTYNTVQTVSSGFGRAPSDVHEFSVINDEKTAITTIFQPAPYDLSHYGIDQQFGWVVEGIFQEIDIATGEVLFEWRSLDHPETVPSETYNTYGSNGTLSGDTVSDIWDYFHLNSVEKDSAGNYLISSRYLCALFYVDGTDGSILWRLNGKSNEFTFQGFENNTFPFAFQHHARVQSHNASTTIISLFDNGSDGYVNISPSSAAMVMAIDTATKTCALLNSYQIKNDTGVLVQSTSQGSTQILDNTNVFVGWGSEPYISEFTEDGTLVMQGQFGAENLAASYRAFKAPSTAWVANPDSTPAIFSNASMATNDSFASTNFYTSWNGATEITSWRFFGGSSAKNVSTALGTVLRTGFETMLAVDEYVAWGYVEALSGDERVLGTSPIRQTYARGLNMTVPNDQYGMVSNGTTSSRRWRA